MKKWYSAKELAGIGGLSKYPTNVTRLAKRDRWETRKATGVKGGGFEYLITSIPLEAQEEIKQQRATELFTSTPVKEVAVTAQSREVKLSNAELSTLKRMLNVDGLTQRQRDCADARMFLVAYVLRLQSDGWYRLRAINHLVDSAKSAALPSEVMDMIHAANAKAGSTRLVSVRTLNQWVLDYVKCDTPAERLSLMAPGKVCKTAVHDVYWMLDFMAIYRNKNGLPVTEAYEQLVKNWRFDKKAPSLTTVRRSLNKIPRHIREVGRKTGDALKVLNTYIRRDWSALRTNDVWVGDGHAMKMKVAHPIHGRPFIPELTLIIDAPSRYVVGWSMALAENCIAIVDAMRSAIAAHGIPVIYYSDNGGGEKNNFLDADITGVFPRLGIHHETGIPGNPQGRGIIERLNRTLALRIARNFETYHGTGVDSNTARIVSRGVISLEKALRDGASSEELTRVQRAAVGKLPSWQQLLDVVQEEVDLYNNERVHSEIGITPAQARAVLAEEVEIVRATEVELRDMHTNCVKRIPQRGWIRFDNNHYFHNKLLDFDGQELIVAVDIHDANQVYVRDTEGVHICDAIWNGNTREAFPVSFVDKKRNERLNNRLKLKQTQVAEIKEEANPVITLIPEGSANLLQATSNSELLNSLNHSLLSGNWGDASVGEKIPMLPSEMEHMKKLAGE